MDKYRKACKAYMTVEASLLLPLITMGIVFTLYLGFYLYNVCLLRQIAYTAALRGSLQKEGNNAQIEEYTNEQLKDLISQRLLAIENLESRVEVTFSVVRVKLSMSMQMPLAKWFFPGAGLWEFAGEAKAKRLEPVTIIRGIRAMGGKNGNSL